MKRRFTYCPRCFSQLVPCTAMSGNESQFWLECSKCNTYVNTYIAQPHQDAIHRDPHTYVGNFGGYGTGKTLTSREEVIKHVLTTPKANVLIGANVASQYEQTIKKELEDDLPFAFVSKISIQKNYFTLLNGARIMYRPLAAPDKLRSFNLTMFVMVEASETAYEAYSQLKTRLRNTNAGAQKRDKQGNLVFQETTNGLEIPVMVADWRKGIIESNPDSGWIRTEVLLAADVINKHGRVLDDYLQDPNEKDPATSAHVASTDVNLFLPERYIEENSKNKPAWWVSRFILGSFSYAEGLVYPSFAKRIIPTFEVPRTWKRLIAFDYGLSDDAVFLYGAIDPFKGLLYIYKEVRINNKSVEELAKIYKENAADIPQGGLAFAPLIDPRSAPRRDYEKKSLADHFLDYGIMFEPGHIDINARVYRVNTYLESGRLFIMDCCTGLIKEGKEYKFQPKSLDKASSDKPVDKNNHALNPLEWMCMRLPADPKNILYGVYNARGEDITLTQKEKQGYLPAALQDDEEEDKDAFYDHMF